MRWKHIVSIHPDPLFENIVQWPMEDIYPYAWFVASHKSLGETCVADNELDADSQ